MMNTDLNDTEYLSLVSMGAVRLGEITKKALGKVKKFDAVAKD